MVRRGGRGGKGREEVRDGLVGKTGRRESKRVVFGLDAAGVVGEVTERRGRKESRRAEREDTILQAQAEMRPSGRDGRRWVEETGGGARFRRVTANCEHIGARQRHGRLIGSGVGDLYERTKRLMMVNFELLSWRWSGVGSNVCRRSTRPPRCR